MSKKSQDKRKARSKEKAKEARRARGTSPLARLGAGEEGIECWMLHDTGGDMMEQISVFRRVRGGGAVSAFFLIDYECIGLKDAFYDLNASPSELLGMLRESARVPGTKLDRISPEEVRRKVAGAIRWSREHGFRLPADMERALKILGGEVDGENGDVSDFGAPGGGLHYVGLRVDLKKRLLDETVEEFLDREDVTADFMEESEESEEDDFSDDAEDEEYEEEEQSSGEELLEQTVIAAGRAITKGIEKECRAAGVEPPAELMLAARMQAVATFVGGARALSEKTDAALEGEKIIKELFEDVKEEAPEKLAAVREAFARVKEYVRKVKPGENFPGMQEEVERLILERSGGESGEGLGELDAEDEEEGEEGTEMEWSEAFAQQRARTSRRLADGVRRWCFANGKPVPPRLDEAANLMMDSIGQATGETEEDAARGSEQGLARLLSLESDEARVELVAALTQVREFMNSFPSGEAMAESLGIEDVEDKEGEEDE